LEKILNNIFLLNLFLILSYQNNLKNTQKNLKLKNFKWKTRWNRAYNNDTPKNIDLNNFYIRWNYALSINTSLSEIKLKENWIDLRHGRGSCILLVC